MPSDAHPVLRPTQTLPTHFFISSKCVFELELEDASITSYVTDTFPFYFSFSQADKGPVYNLDILRNRDAVFKNWITNTTLATVPIAKVLNTTLHHRMEVTYGPKGHIDYTLTYKEKHITESEIMHVTADGYTGTGGC